jgi:hypothetical protein
MFEDYLEDAYQLASMAEGLSTEDRAAKRYYRASIFYAISAIESFINYIGDMSAIGEVFQPFEIALLTDRRFALDNKGHFAILEQVEYHRLEDKLKFLIGKSNPTYEFGGDWSRFMEFKRLRDSITHPRQDEDELAVALYREQVEHGLSSTIRIMNEISKGLFGRPLRKKLVELSA